MIIAARLRKPHDGLFSGTIDALDTVNNTYRITFERAGFGTYSVPDIDVVVRIATAQVCLCRVLKKSNETTETVFASSHSICHMYFVSDFPEFTKFSVHVTHGFGSVLL